MKLPRFLHQPAIAPNAPRIPFSLSWRSDEAHLLLEFRFRSLRQLEQAIGTATSPVFGLLLGSVESQGDTEIIRIIDEETLTGAGQVRLEQRISTWLPAEGKHMWVVGFYVDAEQADPAALSQKLAKFAPSLPPRMLLLKVHRDATVSVDRWHAGGTSSLPVGLTFPLRWTVLRERDYAPFEPYYFSTAAPARADTPVEAPPASVAGSSRSVIPMAPQRSEPPAALPGFGAGTAAAAPARAPEWMEARREKPRTDVVFQVGGGTLVLVGLGAAIVAGLVFAVTLSTVLSMREKPAGSGTGSAPVEQRKPAPDPPSSRKLGLTVQHLGSDIRVMWNGNAPVIQNAASGILYVTENGRRLAILLSASTLKSGRILYAPTARDTQLQLRVTSTDGVFEESLRVLSP